MAAARQQKAKSKTAGRGKKPVAKAGRKKASKASKKRSAKRKKIYKYTARTADKHELYEESVQNPESDVKFLTRVFKKENGRLPLGLREDFCGTGFLCAEWVKSNPERFAVGIDLDRPTLDWGIDRHMKPMGEPGDRVDLLCKNVLDVNRPKVDCAVAFNFSYCTFQDRQDLLRYMKTARSSLRKGGMFVLDIHGGPESLEEIEEDTDYDDFTYVWDQGPIDALTNHTHRAIHFSFPDGSRMRNAFRYDWRVWTMPELQDLLREAGFRRIDIYWEGFDEDGEGNGIFRKIKRAENDDSWIAYVVAWL